MKKLLLISTICFSIYSCKKTTTPEFVATDVTGSCTLKGNVTRSVIVPDGKGGWATDGKIFAKGINVSVKVNRSDLYPGSSAQGADVYYGTSDSLGYYTINVKTNSGGVNAQVTFDGFNANLDTLINGKLKKGAYSTYQTYSTNKTLAMGQNSQMDYNFIGSPINSNSSTQLNTGTAVITGNVYVNLVKLALAGTLQTISSVNVGLGSRKVYMNFSNDPNTFNTRYYETQTDANGAYTFTINTVTQGNAGFLQNAYLWVEDYAATRDTVAVNNTIKTGKSGVFQNKNTTENGVYRGAIRNGVNFVYNTFTPN